MLYKLKEAEKTAHAKQRRREIEMKECVVAVACGGSFNICIYIIYAYIIMFVYTIRKY